MLNILNRDELITLFVMTKKQLDVLIENGLPYFLIGNTQRFCSEDVHDFLKTHYKTLIPNTEFYTYICENNLQFSDFWVETELLSFFNISIEDLALSCYWGFKPHIFDNKAYFKKTDFLNHISHFKGHPINNNTIPTIEKVFLPFPCFITDAGYSETLSAYRCGITILESETNTGHLSFNGSLTSGGSAYAEIIALYRTFKIITEENIPHGSILTDQKRFVDFWKSGDDSMLQFIKTKTFLSHIADFILEFRSINKDNFVVEHISDNIDSTQAHFPDIYHFSYQNSHFLCQNNIKNVDDSNISLDLSKYSFKEDFISLISLNKGFENNFFLKTHNQSNETPNVFSVMLWDLFKDKTSFLEMKFSPNSLHSLLIACTNYKNYNRSSILSILLSDSEKQLLESIKKKKQLTKSDKIILKHYDDLIKKNCSFVDSNFEEHLNNLSKKIPSLQNE